MLRVRSDDGVSVKREQQERQREKKRERMGPKMPGAKQHLSARQERLARARVRDPNATLYELGDAAGYKGPSKSVVSVSAWRAVNNPNVKARIRELMELRPATQLGGLLNTLEDGLQATETKYFSHQGKVVDKRVTTDYATRKGYLDTALELHGAKERTDAGTVNNFFSKEAIEAFVDAFKRPPPQANGNDT